MLGIVRIMERRQSPKFIVVYDEPAWLKDQAEFDNLEHAKAYAEILSKKYNTTIVYHS